MVSDMVPSFQSYITAMRTGREVRSASVAPALHRLLPMVESLEVAPATCSRAGDAEALDKTFTA